MLNRVDLELSELFCELGLWEEGLLDILPKGLVQFCLDSEALKNSSLLLLMATLGLTVGLIIGSTMVFSSVFSGDDVILVSAMHISFLHRF